MTLYIGSVVMDLLYKDQWTLDSQARLFSFCKSYDHMGDLIPTPQLLASALTGVHQ